MNVYVKGATVRLKAPFTDPDTNQLVDPTTVVIKTKDPGGAVVSQTVTQDAIGKYHADVVVTTPGTWEWRVEASGSYAGAFEGEFKVLAGSF